MKNFEEDYKEHMQEQMPDLWNRIEQNLRHKEVSAEPDKKKIAGKKTVRFKRYMTLAAAVLFMGLIARTVWDMQNKNMERADQEMVPEAAVANQDEGTENGNDNQNSDIAADKSDALEDEQEELRKTESSSAGIKEESLAVAEDKVEKVIGKTLDASIQILEEVTEPDGKGTTLKYYKVLMTADNKEIIAAISEKSAATLTIGESYEISYYVSDEAYYDIIIYKVIS